MANATANAPLAMTGEQFQHLANLFVTAKHRISDTGRWKVLRHSSTDVMARYRNEPVSGSETGRVGNGVVRRGTDFLFDLIKKTTYGNLRQTTKTWLSQTDPAITWSQLREKVSHQFLSSVEQMKMQMALEGAKQKPDETTAAYIRRFVIDTDRTHPTMRSASDEVRVVSSMLKGLTDRKLAGQVCDADEVDTLADASKVALAKEAKREK